MTSYGDRAAHARCDEGAQSSDPPSSGLTTPVAAFLEAFDAYAAARKELRQMNDEGTEYRWHLDHCRWLWDRLCDARVVILDSGMENAT